MQVSLSTFVWLLRLFFTNDEKSRVEIDFDGLRQTIFDAQSDGHITVAEGFAILEAVLSMVMPASPFDMQKGPSDATVSGASPNLVRGKECDRD